MTREPSNWLDQAGLRDLVVSFSFEDWTITVVRDGHVFWFVARDLLDIFDLADRPEPKWARWLSGAQRKAALAFSLRRGRRLHLADDAVTTLTKRCADNRSFASVAARFERSKNELQERWRKFHPDQVAISKKSSVSLRKTGLSLTELFDEQIGLDPIVSTIVEQGSGHTFVHHGFSGTEHFSCDGTQVLERRFLHKRPLWPVAFDDADLFVEWCDQHHGKFAHLDTAERKGRLSHLAEPGPSGRAALRASRVAADIVKRRYLALIRLLRNGALEAFGVPMRGGHLEPIPHPIWSTPGIRVDFCENAVHIVEPREASSPIDARKTQQLEQTHCLWIGITIRRVQQALEEPAATAEAAPKNKGGKPPKYNWPRIIELLVLSYGTHGKPENAPELYQRVKDLFIYDEMKRDDISLDTIRQKLQNDYELIFRDAEGTLNLKALPALPKKPQKLR